MQVRAAITWVVEWEEEANQRVGLSDKTLQNKKRSRALAAELHRGFEYISDGEHEGIAASSERQRAEQMHVHVYTHMIVCLIRLFVELLRSLQLLFPAR